QQEVQGSQVRQLEALHFALAHAGKMPLDTLGRDFADQNRIILGLAGDQADIDQIALIAGAGVSQLDQLSLYQFALGHIATSGWTSDFGISAGQNATISSTRGRPRPKPDTPGGPFSTSGAISRVKRSTAARFSDRTPTRKTTTGRCGSISGAGSAEGIPWQALAPRNSVRISSKRRPRRLRRWRRIWS